MTKEDGKNSNAPPQLLILLWHHFCYYKRHWAVLVFTILLPFIFIIGISVIISFSAKGKIMPLEMSPDSDKPMTYPTLSFLSAGPLATHLSSISNCYVRGNPPFKDRSVLDSLLRDDLEDQCVRVLETAGISCKIAERTEYSNGSESKRSSLECEDGVICAALQKLILFYPNGSMFTDEVTGKMKEILHDYDLFYSEFPISWQTVSNKIIDNVLQTIHDYKKCLRIKEDRVIGFNSKEDALSYAEKHVDKIGEDFAYRDQIWGIIGFEDAESEINYKIAHLHRNYRDPDQIRWLQDFLEEAIVQVSVGRKDRVKAYKNNPERCWTTASSSLVVILRFMLTFAIIMSFLMPPVNFLQQVLMEKRLKLREYLYIMGVGEWTLKFSWMLFYLIFLLPLAAIWTLTIKYQPAAVFGRLDGSIVFMLLLLFNIAQLSFCYMLSSFLKTEQRTSVLLSFLHLFFWVLILMATASFKGGGTSTISLLRLSCLYPTVPVQIAINYILSWEQNGVGAQWRHNFLSPYEDDLFGGIGECFLWLCLDTVLYLFLAWYLEKVMPGDFGVEKPFYFPFLPSYWFPQKFRLTDYEVENTTGRAIMEPAPPEAEPGIELRNLTKFYTKDKIGVNQLSLSFFQNEITAFLGENGAGKSTTMNILVGMISKTSGSAQVLGHDVSTETEKVRKMVGFVPQYDILYPSMTVEEHLQFYGWLKGMSKTQIKCELNPILCQLGLENHGNTKTTKLSGGQKRKLSIITAFLQSPKAIILDEPTSGVDPFSRRSIWDMLLQRRRQATIILSTHFMQEADILGDRVAIISEGELRSFGTPMFLKNKLGKGFSLSAACDSAESRQRGVDEFMAERDVAFLKRSGNDLFYSIPSELAGSENMIPFLENLELRKEQLGIVSYGISETTMEEVFFNSIDKLEPELPPEPQEDTNGIPLNPNDQPDHETSDCIYYSNLTGPKAWLHQIQALSIKKLHTSFLSPYTYFLQLGLPLCFILLLLVVGSRISEAFGDENPRKIGVWKPYQTNKLFFQSEDNIKNTRSTDINEYIRSSVEEGFWPHCPEECPKQKISLPLSMKSNPKSVNVSVDCPCSMKTISTKHCTSNVALEQPNAAAKSGDIVYRVGFGADLQQWILGSNETESPTIGGFQFLSLSNAGWSKFKDRFDRQPAFRNWVTQLKATTREDYVIIYSQKSYEYGMANVWSNLEKAVAGKDQNAIVGSMQTVSSQTGRRDQGRASQMLGAISGSIFLMLAFGFGIFGIAALVQTECSSGMKRFQLMFGTNPILYHTVHLFFDFLLYLLTVTAVVVLLAIFKNAYRSHLGALCLIALPYGLFSITFIYFASFAFRRTRGIVIFTIVAFIISLFLAAFFTSAESICTLFGDCPLNRIVAVGPVFRFIPSYFIVDGILLIAIATGMSAIPSEIGPEGFQYPDLAAWSYLKGRVITALVFSALYFGLTLLFEFLQCRIGCCACCSCKLQERAGANPLSWKDPDVATEESKVNQGDLKDPLIVQNLSKTYAGKAIPAVAGISFSVPEHQCFGLLGINGAGKTTTFSMLTGYLQPTSGIAKLDGIDLLQTKSWSKMSSSAYCPQENTLFANLTVRQHLSFFAKLRAVPSSHQSNLINALIREVGLSPHVSKMASQLSGGNQRKLQFAIALLGYKSVIFLDEPTTGMDPGARRKAWQAVKRAVARGSSVILTSHSMEECEELCHRLVIMVAGSFQCIGSVQYLKNKFGNKYTFKLKLKPSETETKTTGGSNASDSVKNYIQQKYPTAILLEEHATLLSYEVGTERLPLSSLFETLFQCKNTLPVEDFTVSQVTLEHVFINMAKLQETVQSGFYVQPNSLGVPTQGIPLQGQGQLPHHGVGPPPAMQVPTQPGFTINPGFQYGNEHPETIVTGPVAQGPPPMEV